MDSKRLYSIDTLRFFAIWGVIIIHAHYFFNWPDKPITGWVKIPEWFMDEASSFAVSLFFMISGYFFGKSFLKEKNITKIYRTTMQRLLIVFIGWSLIYSLNSFQPFSAHQWPVIQQHGWARAYYWHMEHDLKNPIVLLMIGTAGHLWFISALMQVLTIILFFVYFKLEKFLIYFALLLYMLNPIAIHYLHPLPGYSYDWNPLTEPIGSTLYVVLGWWFSKRDNASSSFALQVLVIGMLLAGIDLINKSYGLHLPLARAAAIFIPFSLFLYALLKPEWSSNTILPALGRMTLGIYCVHPLVMLHLQFLKSLTPQSVWIFPIIILTYLISLGIVLVLKIHPWTRKLVI